MRVKSCEVCTFACIRNQFHRRYSAVRLNSSTGPVLSVEDIKYEIHHHHHHDHLLLLPCLFVRFRRFGRITPILIFSPYNSQFDSDVHHKRILCSFRSSLSAEGFLSSSQPTDTTSLPHPLCRLLTDWMRLTVIAVRAFYCFNCLLLIPVHICNVSFFLNPVTSLSLLNYSL